VPDLPGWHRRRGHLRWTRCGRFGKASSFGLEHATEFGEPVPPRLRRRFRYPSPFRTLQVTIGITWATPIWSQAIEDLGVWSPWIPFDLLTSKGPPTQPGVYMVRLGAEGLPVYVGKAGSVATAQAAWAHSRVRKWSLYYECLGFACANRAFLDPMLARQQADIIETTPYMSVHGTWLEGYRASQSAHTVARHVARKRNSS